MEKFIFEQSVNGIISHIHELYHFDGFVLSDVHLKIQETKDGVTLFRNKTFLIDNNEKLKTTLTQVVDLIFKDLPKIKEGMKNYIAGSTGSVVIFFLKWPNQSQF